MQAAITTPVPETESPGADLILQQAKHLAKEFQSRTADNLHEYRRHIKNLRYLAEFLAVRDPHTAHQAKALTKIQSAIGEWRDWHLLTLEARHTLKAPESALTNQLAATEAKALRKALDTSRRATTQLLHEKSAVQKAAWAQRKVMRPSPV